MIVLFNIGKPIYLFKEVASSTIGKESDLRGNDLQL